MIKDGRRPAATDMAIIALTIGLNVFGWFARCSAAIVAFKAIATDLGMIHSFCRRPGIYAMAGIAGTARDDVARIFACRINAGTGTMAALTGTRRALKYPAWVASRAIYRGMATGERKGRHGVIKALLRASTRGYCGQAEHKSGDQDE